MSKIDYKEVFNGKYLVARSNYGGLDTEKCQSKKRCPIFNDYIPYKSVTVKCKEEEVDQVIDCLSYVHGGDCVSNYKSLEDGYVAIRSDYKSL